MKKAFIFDMDGVIVDNYRYHLSAWKGFCHHHNLDIPEDIFRSVLFGRNNQFHLEYLFGRTLSGEELRVYAAEKEKIYREHYAAHIILLPGLSEFLRGSAGLGIPMAVATSAPPENVAFVFEHTGIRHYFRAVVDPTGVRNGKPAPDIFLKAARLLGAEPEHCVVFEDSLPGIEAGIAAGMKVLGVATTHHAEDLYRAHEVIADFREIEPANFGFPEH